MAKCLQALFRDLGKQRTAARLWGQCWSPDGSQGVLPSGTQCFMAYPKTLVLHCGWRWGTGLEINSCNKPVFASFAIKMQN